MFWFKPTKPKRRGGTSYEFKKDSKKSVHHPISYSLALTSESEGIDELSQNEVYTSQLAIPQGWMYEGTLWEMNETVNPIR